jgi:acetylornithine deacetylase/succinyl-diaminopimelate desuccinylase-like protein
VRFRVVAFLLPVLLTASGQTQSPQSVLTARDYRERNQPQILKDFAELLSLPNVATPTTEGRANIQRNAEHIERLLKQRGLRTQILNVEDGFPAVYGELIAPGATKTIVFYAHYDGQPVDAAKWNTPPFEAVLRKGGLDAERVDIASLSSLPPGSDDWRIYARSSSDDKAPIIGFLAALDALRAAGITPSVNLKFFFEGEEEAGSEHLAALLEKHADLLKADLWVLCDGPVHQSGRMQLVYGVRGVMGLEMTVYGPNRGLHSGHYGNWAPNAAVEIAEIIASMRDSNGRIKILGFYEAIQPPTSGELQALGRVPNIDQRLKDELALGRVEGGGKALNRLIMDPAINLRGIRAGSVGAQAANAVPTEGTASIDFRLVPNQTPEIVRRQVESHLRRRGYYIVSNEPDAPTRRRHPRLIRVQWEKGYPASRTPLDSAPARAVKAVLDRAISEPLIQMPTLGGSLPMYLFAEKLRTPVVIFPIANFDNNQHSHNENIRLSNLWNGIEAYAALFAELGREWK